MRVDGAVCAELAEADDGMPDLALLEQRHELVSQAGRGEVSDQAHLDAAASEPERVAIHREAVAVLVANRPEDTSGIVDEGEVVQYADCARVEVPPSPERIDEPSEVVALE